MTEEKAIQTLKNVRENTKIMNINRNPTICFSKDMVDAFAIAIQALEEVQQYKKIGTIEDMKALKNNNSGKTPITAQNVEENGENMKLYIVSADTCEERYGMTIDVFAICDTMEKATEIKNQMKNIPIKIHSMNINETNLNEMTRIELGSYIV